MTPPSPPLPLLYGIACADALGAERVPEAVEAMAAGGVEWIQLRLKSGDDRTRCAVIEQSLRRLDGSAAQLWIDDRADLAALYGLPGVHLGQHDLPPDEARCVVPPTTRVGWSCHDSEQVAAADADPSVDVVAIGPVFATASKQNPDPVVGLDGVAAARRATSKHLVAIGGLEAETVASVRAAGADTVVVLGALCRAGDAAAITASARRLARALEGAERDREVAS
ncbi:MAG: thiamine phosphate synthase [Acidobacteriota bacterium]